MSTRCLSQGGLWAAALNLEWKQNPDQVVRADGVPRPITLEKHVQSGPLLLPNRAGRLGKQRAHELISNECLGFH